MNILIIKTSSLGDIVQAFPVLEYLKQQLPTASIDWVVEAPFESLIKAHPALSETMTIQTRKWRLSPFSKETWKEILSFRKKLRAKRYDIIFDLQGNIKSASILAMSRGKEKVGFGFRSAPEWPSSLAARCRFNPPKGQNIRKDYLFIVQSFFKDSTPPSEKELFLNISSEERLQLEDILARAASQTYQVIVCPGSAWENKKLSPGTLAAVLQEIEKHHQAYFFFVWGTHEERLLCCTISSYFPNRSSILEKTSLPLLQNLMARVNLVVAMDSLPLHLCGTTLTSSLSFFGPSSAKKYCPTGERHRSIQGVCPYGVVFEKRCPRLRSCPTGACMKEMNVIQLNKHSR